jgi:hypothetical protein
MLTCVVDCTVAVGVRSLQDIEQILAVLPLAKPNLKLLERDTTITILIKLLKDLLQLHHLFWI